MVHWWLNLHPWQQFVLFIPALCLLFCLYFVLWSFVDAWKLQTQAEQDRRVLATSARRFQEGQDAHN